MRVFLALPLPAETVRGLQEGLAELGRQYCELKVVRPQGLHITLVFLGERREQEVEAIRALLHDPSLAVPPIRASLSGYGQFPPQGIPRVLYSPLIDGAAEVTALQHSLTELLRRGQVRFEEEKRAFSPHLTLARNSRNMEARPEAQRVRELLGAERRFTFDRLVLFQSLLKRDGAEYRPLETVLFR
jgi:2'-5' RNA ligase